MKKLIFTVIVLSVCMVLGRENVHSFTWNALAAELESETETESWMDYQLTIGEDVYIFPMMYEDFVSFGWTLEDEEEKEETIAPYRYDIFYFTKEDQTCSVFLLNLGINTVSIEECIVAGISIDRFYWSDTDDVVSLPGEVVKGVSTLDEILEAYGTPTNTYEGELYTRLTYQEDYNQEIELEIYHESGVLEDIQIENFIEPDGYEEGEVGTEIPQSVLAYTKPDSLGYDLSEYEIEVDGEVYSLPVPVSVLLDDGWTLDTENSDSLVAAQYYGWVTLRKNNQVFTTTVVNGEDFATIPEYCWLEGISVGGYTVDLDGSLPGEVRIGITEEEFLEILDDNGISYAYTQSGDYRYYSYNNPSYGSGCEVTIYIGDDSIFEKDTIIEVSCENALE